jgi:hypothetical protein
MNAKKFLVTFIVVYVLLEAMNFIIHGVILASTYQMPNVQAAFRHEAEMNSNMWIVFVTDLVWAFFFVFFFAKGYEGKGIMEGLRFGFYMGLFWALVSSYQTYAFVPMPYSLAFKWFIFGMIEMLILGVVAALIYKPAAAQIATA